MGGAIEAVDQNGPAGVESVAEGLRVARFLLKGGVNGVTLAAYSDSLIL